MSANNKPRLKVFPSLLLSLLVSCCATSSPADKKSGFDYEQTTICEINKNPDKYFGKIVRIKATYKTDGIVTSGLFDLQCKGNGVIESKSKSSKLADKTVVDYNKWHSMQKENCARQGKGYCSVEVDVDISGLVVKNSLGDLMIEYSHVYDFKPQKPY